ncbi:MAG: MDR family MFS transporter [Trebonia sp.]
MSALADRSAVARGRRAVLIGLILTMGLAAMDTTIVATAIPIVVRDLGGFSLFAWVFSAYVLAQVVSIPVYGRLADFYGRKRLLILGTIVFLGGSMLSGLAWSMVSLIAFRGLQGLGAGAIQALVYTVAGDLYDVRERGRIQGWLSSVWGISAVLGPLLGGALAEYASWRWIFFINVPLGIAALIVISTRLHEQVTPRRHSIDYGGALLMVGGVGLLVFGLLQGGVAWSWTSRASVGVFAGALALLAAFAWCETRVAEPIAPPWMIRGRLMATTNAATVGLGLLIIALSEFLPTYLQGVYRTSAIVAGLCLATMSITWPIMSALSARLYLRLGFRDPALLGAGLTLSAGLMFALTPSSAPFWSSALESAVMGAGLGLISTPVLVGLQSVVAWEQRGSVTGANMFSRYLGQTVGAAIAGSIANASLPPNLHNISSAIASGPVSPRVRAALDAATHNVFWALVAAAVLCVVALAVTPRHFSSPI